ncbi:Nudix family hydrolase, partial [Cognatilysobacter segetis]|uniref:Nudix family hydrolase n=1 Tax=Cognatilysobacter segetis TaxID=2492394 RepID=UPI0010613D1C
LARELHEELGIEARIGAPLIRVPQRYPDKDLALDVRQVEAWQGPARGREGQALVWAPADKLARYDMPPADRPVVAALLQPATYAVTPALDDLPTWLGRIDAALAAGVQRIQLRSPGQGDAARWRAAVADAAARARDAGAEVLVNADVELARTLGIGVHLRASQLAELAARPLPPDQAVAASCHGLEDLLAAERLGCDFTVLGHVADTPSHPGRPPLGWEAFARLRESVSLPIYAIGGVGPDDLATARFHGAQGIAGMRAFFPASASA